MSNEFQLSYLNDQDRLNAYQAIVNGCSHMWSKAKLQIDRFKEVAETFINLADKDPIFLAHFTSYALTKLDSKDLKVVSTFFNALSDADGMPFVVSEGPSGKVYSSKYDKPNLRLISQVAIQMLPPELVVRVVELANLKLAFGERFKEATHFPKSLKTAIIKFVRYREQNPQILKGIKKSGLTRKFKNLYRAVRIAPSIEAAEILRWSQKDGREIKKADALSFKGLTDLQIAEKIQSEKISPMVALGALPEKLTPVVAIAVLEQATGNQAVILQSQFETQGLLRNKEIKALFAEKVKTAKDALDRVDRMNTRISEDIKKVLNETKAEKRKEIVGDMGRIAMHIDISSSMSNAIEEAKNCGAILAECVKNPEENFFMYAFNTQGFKIKNPETFTKDGFMSALYGLRTSGSTNCLATYSEARKNNVDVDVYLTDQEHNSGNIDSIVQNQQNKPKAVIIVDFSSNRKDLYQGFIRNEIPVTIMKPGTLTQSALVAQAVKTALKGQVALVDEIMDTPLLKLPRWWDSISGK